MAENYIKFNFNFSDGSTQTVQIPKSVGYTPVKGIDYWTDADQESIVQQVIAALGTPVFGTVNTDKVITLTGALADGTYTVKYEDADGNETTIGTLTAKAGPTYTNQIPISINADGTPCVGLNGEKGYKVGYRIKSDGSVVELNGYNCTGLIPATVSDTIYFSTDMKFNDDSTNSTKIALYDENFAHLGQSSTHLLVAQPSQAVSEGLVVDSQGNIVALTPMCLRYWLTKDAVEKTAYFRVASSGISSNSIITVNEPIE